MRIYVNQGMREAEELVQIDDETLVEYEMPNGSTALRILSGPTDDRGRTVSYAAVPLRWLQALVDESVTWQGHPQQARLDALQPAELLARRRRTSVRSVVAKPPAEAPTWSSANVAAIHPGAERHSQRQPGAQ